MEKIRRPTKEEQRRYVKLLLELFNANTIGPADAIAACFDTAFTMLYEVGIPLEGIKEIIDDLHRQCKESWEKKEC